MSPRELEELAMNAWPAPQTLLYDGWLLRLNAGYTRRVNSVLPFGPSRLHPEKKVAYREQQQYAGRDQPAIFKLSRPPSLLHGCRSPPPEVMRRKASPTCRRWTWRCCRPRVQAVRRVPGVDSRFFEGWLRAYFRLTDAELRHFDTAVRQLRLPALPAAFLTLEAAGDIAGTGLAVAERGGAGPFEIAVAPERRNHGLGGRITYALLDWGRQRGAEAVHPTSLNHTARLSP